MEFNSFIYPYVFIPVVLAAYLIFRRYNYVNFIILIASYVFYGFVTLWFLIPLLISSVFDFFIGKKISDSDDQVLKKRLVILSVVINLSLLSFFKYTTWITTELSQFLAFIGAGLSMSPYIVPLPPGISFYTFQTMGYTIDIYKGDFKPQRNFINYLTYVSFFPQLVAGPIERAGNLIPQIAEKRKLVSGSVASTAIFMILFGLFQKIVLADNFGGIIDFIQRLLASDNENLAPGMGFVFMYAFAFQIYCDFSAYTNIARGSALLFNIKLQRNFLTPYFSASPSEFWNRWHISLSSWLKDYLYIPLGGNKSGKIITMRNLLITMTLGGLWHGAGVFFIVWGLYHGLLLVLYHTLPIDQILENKFGATGKAISIFIFFHLVCIGWIFFRATPDQFFAIVNSIIDFPIVVLEFFHKFNYSINASIIKTFINQNWHLSAMSWGLIIFSVPLILTDILAFRYNCEFPDLFQKMNTLLKVILIVLLSYLILFFGRREANEFIYFAF